MELVGRLFNVVWTAEISYRRTRTRLFMVGWRMRKEATVAYFKAVSRNFITETWKRPRKSSVRVAVAEIFSRTGLVLW